MENKLLDKLRKTSYFTKKPSIEEVKSDIVSFMEEQALDKRLFVIVTNNIAGLQGVSVPGNRCIKIPEYISYQDVKNIFGNDDFYFNETDRFLEISWAIRDCLEGKKYNSEYDRISE